MPFVTKTSSDALAPGSFLLLVVRPGATFVASWTSQQRVGGPCGQDLPGDHGDGRWGTGPGSHPKMTEDLST